MTDLYQQHQYSSRTAPYSHIQPNVYPSPITPQSTTSGTHSHNVSGDEHEDDDTSPPKSAEASPTEAKAPQKTQSTFLTKLYALLEKPENQHMIRWDSNGDHIIVERPEQLALHVLPSVYRQSRFASFSRQLNIYGFMRKVNLRNVDPAIDDPDASTWSHPTLNRHSPPEVVANFKRRVPPRLPKPRKRQDQEMAPVLPMHGPPRSGVPLSVPSSLGSPGSKGRARGFSAPGSYLGPNPTNWGVSNSSYQRAALPPLTVPSDSPAFAQSSVYGGSHSAHPGLQHPISPADDHVQSPAAFSPPAYGSTGSMSYGYSDSGSWATMSPTNPTSTQQNTGSLSSLLNPSGSQYQRGSLQTASGYPSQFSTLQNSHSASSMSPDSRPTTGYSVTSMTYESETPSSALSSTHPNDYSRPGSSHHRPMSPRPHSGHKTGLTGLGGINSAYSSSGTGNYSGVGLSNSAVRRPRRHSQAMSPYPSPYDTPNGASNGSAQQAHHLDSSTSHGTYHTPAHHGRPSSSPQPAGPGSNHHVLRARSMVQLPTVDTNQTSAYTFSPGGEFAYSAGGVGGGSPPLQADGAHTTMGTGHLSSVDSMNGWGNRNVRPSTSTSSLSSASHASSSQANTPPMDSSYLAGEDLNRSKELVYFSDEGRSRFPDEPRYD